MTRELFSANPEKRHSKFGYDEMKLRSAIAMAGVRDTGNFISEVTGYNVSTGYKKLKDGMWTRADIAHLVDSLRLTEQQTFEIFFSGLEPEYDDEDRKKYRPWWSEETRRRRNIAKNVAEQLDDAMNFMKEIDDDEMERGSVQGVDESEDNESEIHEVSESEDRD